MAGDTDGRASGRSDRARLRAAHADRDHVIGVLKTAFIRGMLDKDEFDRRIGQTYASRTYAELAGVTADLPAGLPAAVPGPATGPDEGWLTMKRAFLISACLVIPTALGLVIGLPFADGYDDAVLVNIPFLAFFAATMISGPLLLTEARDRQRTRPRLPQAPASGTGQVARGPRTRGSWVPQRRRRSADQDLAIAVTA